MGLRRIWTISHGRLDHSRHCCRGRGSLAPTIRFFVMRAGSPSDCCAEMPHLALHRQPSGLLLGHACMSAFARITDSSQTWRYVRSAIRGLMHRSKQHQSNGPSRSGPEPVLPLLVALILAELGHLPHFIRQTWISGNDVECSFRSAFTVTKATTRLSSASTLCTSMLNAPPESSIVR
jgi:hypothetical protein